MPMETNKTVKGAHVLVARQDGVTVIPDPTPLTRLNYFDGKFLRAEDLRAEQQYLRRLVELSNQGGGPGVAYGFDISLGGEALNIGPGLAFDPTGRVLLLPEKFSVTVQDLIDKSRQQQDIQRALSAGKGTFGDCAVYVEDAPGAVLSEANLYLITVGFAEALCGQEDVFGKLCEEACTTSSDRPFLVEGINVRAIPLSLRTALPTSTLSLSRVHLRSRVASAYFEDERKVVASFIQGDRLKSNMWCLGADAAGGRDVPIGVLARAGGVTVFLDAWIARRERIDTPAKRYWQWRMAMRPWDVFLAQVLQFQCQLHEVLRTRPAGGADDPCGGSRQIIHEASDTFARLADFYQAVSSRLRLQPLMVSGRAVPDNVPVLEGGLSKLLDLQKRLQAAKDAGLLASEQILIDGGIIETPSAAYLPVVPNSVDSVNQQVRRLLGKGVDLRFCVVRPDFVAHALEEAQHMERISLIEGLAHPDRVPQVDVLVPDGEIVTREAPANKLFEIQARFSAGLPAGNDYMFRGSARIDAPADGGFELALAAETAPQQMKARQKVAAMRSAFGPRSGASLEAIPDVSVPSGGAAVSRALWVSVSCAANPFFAPSAGQAVLDLRMRGLTTIGSRVVVEDYLFSGSLQFNRPISSGAERRVTGRFTGIYSLVAVVSGKRKESNGRVTLDFAGNLATAAGGASSLTLIFTDQATPASFRSLVTWAGSPLEISAEILETATGDPAGERIALGFRQNDAVSEPDEELHQAALDAVGQIGRALAEPDFASQAANQLFPPPPASDELIVKATLDWVLFHRRRTKTCGVEHPAPAVVFPRYQLWHGLVANSDAVGSVVKILHSNEPFNPDRVAFQKVDVLEFNPGLPTLASSPAAVETDWKKVDPGQSLVYTAILPQGATSAEPKSVAEGRLRQFEAAVAAVSALDPDAKTEVLDNINRALAAPDLDGVVVGLTVVQTSCVYVFQVPSPDLLERIRALLANNRIDAAIKLAQELGRVTFRAGTNHVQDDSLNNLAAAWEKSSPLGRPTAGIIVVRTGETEVTDDVAASQVDVIQTAIGPGAKPELLKVTGEVPVSCPVVLFLTAVPEQKARVADVVTWGSRDQEQNREFPLSTLVRLKFTADNVLDGDLPADAISLWQAQGIMVQVELGPLEQNYNEAAAQLRLDSIAEALIKAKVLRERFPRQITKVTAKERGSLTEDDLIFLRRG
jgi:hypothetical protein